MLIPTYLILVMSGVKGVRAVWPATVVCGVSFAVTQFLVSNYIGPYLTDILASIASLTCLVLLLRVWKPRDDVTARGASGVPVGVLLRAWSPYILLVIFVLLWGATPVKAILDKATFVLGWPGLDGAIRRLPPVVAKAAPYAAKFNFNILSAGGTCALFACIGTGLMLRIPVGRFFATIGQTARDLSKSILTMAAVLALAYLMNYSGATTTLGLVIAGTGSMFPFFSPLLGWLGVFLTGSDTSANALFGTLQVVTASSLGMNHPP